MAGEVLAEVAGADGIPPKGDAAGQADGPAVVDPWAALRAHTPARIGMRRAGDAVTTMDQLALRLAHAQARDAVHTALDPDELRAQFAGTPLLSVESAAGDRTEYLQRPDLGRRLADGERARLESAAMEAAEGRGDVTGGSESPDLVFVLADGLSPLAVQRHAAAVVGEVTTLLEGWEIGPVVTATQARVAIGDEIGEALGARFVAVLVGERPGLSAADSLGIYLTYEPRAGRPDSDRNCISNVRPPVGLSYRGAAAKLAALLEAARSLGATGVKLKDNGPLLDA